MARTFRITVNGKSYDVEVEEIKGGVSPAPVAASAPVAVAAPAPAPKASAPAPAASPAPAAPAGGDVVSSPMPGKILKVAVAVGASVNPGDLLVVLEAMKMENEIQASSGGTVKEIRVKEGDSVNTGDVLVVVG